MLAVVQPAREGLQVAAVDDVAGRKRTFSRKGNTPPDQVNLGSRVRVGIDAEHAAKLETALIPPPVEIKPPGVRVDLDRDAMLRAGLQDLLDIDLIARPPQKLSAGHVAEDGHEGIAHRAQDALGLLSRGPCGTGREHLRR